MTENGRPIAPDIPSGMGGNSKSFIVKKLDRNEGLRSFLRKSLD